MTKYYLDSNYVVSLLFTEHEFNSRAVKLARLLSESDISLYLSILTIDEIVHTLQKHYKLTRESIVKILKQFIITSGVEIVWAGDDVQSVLDYFKLLVKGALGVRDTLHVLIMKKNNIKYLVTFDNAFVFNEKKFGIKVVK